jgi:hypothetical protein
MFGQHMLLAGAVSGGGGGAKLINFLGNDGNTSGTFTGCDLGIPAADRRIIVWAGTDGGNSNTISGITVAGEACEMIVQNNGRTACAIGVALVPTGTNGTITVLSSGTAREAIAWWECIGLAGNTAIDTAITNADDDPMSLDTDDGGFMVGGGCHETGSTSTPTTTGDATQRWSSHIGGECGNSGGDAVTDGTSMVITINGINTSRRSACAASF